MRRRHQDIITANEKGILLRHRIRNGAVQLASNAFFFQEGTTKNYETAHYGRFRVNSDGELLLESLHDAQLNKLGPAPQ